jgi:plastocyanin
MIRRLLTCLIALGALVACGGGSTPNGGATPGSAQTITFKETEYSIAPASMTLKPGTYTFAVQNVGQFPHDLHIAASDGSELGATSVMKANGTASIKVTLPQAGTYTTWCAVNSHRSLGMEGTVTVK